MIVGSITLLWLSTILQTILIGLRYGYLYVVQDVILVIAALISILGVSGYRLNIIQFGFDQLLKVAT